VTADSLAFKAGLKRHDILLSYDGMSIRDGKHCLRLLATAHRKAPLVLLRSGQAMTLQVSFAPSPSSITHESPKGTIKPDGPPAVDVEAQPLDGGKLRVIFTFYSTGKGKLEQLTCSGSLAEIQEEVRVQGKRQHIPARVQELIDVALKRLRSLSSQ